MLTGIQRPILHTTAKVILEVSSEDFEDFIETVYGQRYDFVGGEDVELDASLNFEVVRDSLDPYEEEDLRTFVETGEGSMLAHLLLTDLVNKGLLQPAEYEIYAE